MLSCLCQNAGYFGGKFCAAEWRSALCKGVPKERFHCNKKFTVHIQPHLSKIKHVFLFLCSVVTGLPTITKAHPPSQKWVRGKRGGGGAYIPCEWKLTLNDHSTINTVALIQGATKEIDEEGFLEVEVCRDFLYIMFNPLRQILFILYKCQRHNIFSPCAVLNIYLKQKKCYTLPHLSLYMSNKHTLHVTITHVCIWINPKLLRFSDAKASMLMRRLQQIILLNK